MSEARDPVTLALTGALPFVVIAAALIAFPAALFLLALYRRAVLRGMNEASGAPQPLPAASAGASAAPPSRSLQFALLGSRAAPGAPAPGFDAWRAAWVYAASIGVFAAVMTATWLLATRDAVIGPVKLAFLFWTYFWPAVLTVNLVASTDRGTRWRVALAYFAVYVPIAAVALARSPDLTVGQVVQHWLVTNAPPTVLLYAFLARRVRAVGPIVLAFAVLAVLGSQLAVTLVGSSEANMRAAVEFGSAVGLGGYGTFWATIAAGFVVFAIGAWVVLKWLGARYAAKQLSDETLTIDAMMLLFGITHSIGLVFEHWAWIGSGFVAVLGYKLAAVLGYRLLPKVVAPQRLLLLRVFALGARSEPLFDAIRKRWLRGGHIAMIAGPDLVTSAVEPHEFLGFLSGDLKRRFVAGDADLASRIAAMDRKPDPDGRFRVAEFFCRADTWQPTMQRLVAESDAVLMDLRSFSASNQGCVYELGRLLDAIDLSRVVFVIDKTTDRAFLEATLSRLWGSLAASSPNRHAAEPSARLFPVTGPKAAETRALVGYLTSVRTPSPAHPGAPREMPEPSVRQRQSTPS